MLAFGQRRAQTSFFAVFIEFYSSDATRLFPKVTDVVLLARKPKPAGRGGHRSPVAQASVVYGCSSEASAQTTPFRPARLET